MMMPRMLLKSWARPPVRWPMASSFWACTSCCSAKSVSEMSRMSSVVIRSSSMVVVATCSSASNSSRCDGAVGSGSAIVPCSRCRRAVGGCRFDRGTRVRRVLSDGSLDGVAEQFLGIAVPDDNDAATVHRHEGVAGAVDRGSEQGGAFRHVGTRIYRRGASLLWVAF